MKLLLKEYIQSKVEYEYDNYEWNKIRMDEEYIHEYELDQIMNRFENFERMLNADQGNV
jgi:hypothetical protein